MKAAYDFKVRRRFLMKDCPVCHVPLREVPRFGVLLDVCSRCHGVWLDGGELEKVIALAREFHGEFQHYKDYDEHHSYHHHDHYGHHGYHKHKKKRSIFELFEDLFD
jgi:hypothetical protein